MPDWNVVVNLYEKSFTKAFKELQGFGLVNKTNFFNVLTLKVSDIDRFLETFHNWISEHPNLMNKIARAIPVTDTFIFQSPEEFEAKAKEVVLQWVPQLGGKTFHVRMHRRGFKGRLSSNDEERFLDGIILAALEARGTLGKITFDDPDAIIVVETLGQEAGLSCWAREQLQRYSFLKID